MEGLDYKKTLLNLLGSNKVSLSDIQQVDISSSDSEEDDEKKFDDDTVETTTTNVQLSSAEEKNFQTKFIEMQKYMDTEIPAIIASLNTELGMLTRGTTLVSSNDDNVDEFIWKFNFKFDYNNEMLSLPIQQVEHIETLNIALLEESIYEDVFVHLSFVYGKKRLRNMTVAAARLFKMLIDEKCLGRVSWKGKSAKGKESNIAFEQYKNIQKVLLDALQVMDKSYGQENLHEDIVYKILKPAKQKKNKQN